MDDDICGTPDSLESLRRSLTKQAQRYGGSDLENVRDRITAAMISTLYYLESEGFSTDILLPFALVAQALDERADGKPNPIFAERMGRGEARIPVSEYTTRGIRSALVDIYLKERANAGAQHDYLIGRALKLIDGPFLGSSPGIKTYKNNRVSAEALDIESPERQAYDLAYQRTIERLERDQMDFAAQIRALNDEGCAPWRLARQPL